MTGGKPVREPDHRQKHRGCIGEISARTIEISGCLSVGRQWETRVSTEPQDGKRRGQQRQSEVEDLTCDLPAIQSPELQS
jgi:hypothetical protein